VSARSFTEALAAEPLDLDAIRDAEVKAGLDWNLDNAHPLLMVVGPLVDEIRELRAARDSARDWAAALEAQTAAVEMLHAPATFSLIPASNCDDPRGHANRWFDDPWDTLCAVCVETARYCTECSRVVWDADEDADAVNWPCPTVAALTGGEDE